MSGLAEGCSESQFPLRRITPEDYPLNVTALNILICQQSVTFETQATIDFRVSDQCTTRCTTLLQCRKTCRDKRSADALALNSRFDRDGSQSEPAVVEAINGKGGKGNVPDDSSADFGNKRQAQFARRSERTDDGGFRSAAGWYRL